MTDANRDYQRLKDALAEAIELIGEWGAYADTYFQEKWNLAGDIASLRKVLDEVE